MVKYLSRTMCTHSKWANKQTLEKLHAVKNDTTAVYCQLQWQTPQSIAKKYVLLIQEGWKFYTCKQWSHVN